MQHRYFIGLQLPDKLCKTIQGIQQELFDRELILRPLEPHITLLPPPAVERCEPEEMGRQAKATAAPFLPLELTLTSLTTYGKHIIVARVEGRQIHDLQKQLVALLPPEAEAIYYPNPTFTPHVTLCEVRHNKTMPEHLVDDWNEQLADVLPTTFTCDNLTLFKWIAPREYKADTL